MNNPPFSSEFINVYNSQISPSTLHTKNNALFNMFYRHLLRMVYNIYDFTLPEKWNSNFFKWVLFDRGILAVLKTQKFGVIPMDCTVSGFTVFYQPHRAIINNPLFTKSYDLVIGKECEIIYLQPDFCGMSDIIGFYADQMCIASESVMLNTVNSRLSHVFVSNSKGAKVGYQTMMDGLLSGNVAAFINNNMVDKATGKLNYELINNHVKDNFVVLELQEVIRNWEYDFCRVVGIPSQGINKKQRMVVDEVNASNVETAADAENRLECLQESFAKVRKLFGFSESELNVTWKHDPLQKQTLSNVGGEQ